jgi:predicted RNA binding protein YcfA (HicA-like mRNA interferase family)
LSKLRPVKAEKVVKALSKLGFEIARQKGSHLVIPVHSGEDLGRGILRQIAHDAKIGKDESLKVLDQV